MHSLISFHICVSCVSTTQTRTQNVPSSWVMKVSPLGSPASFPSTLRPSPCSWALNTFSSDLRRLPGAYRAPDILSLIAKACPSNARTSHLCLCCRCRRPAPRPPRFPALPLSVLSAHPLTSRSAHPSWAALRTRGWPCPCVTCPS